MRHVLDPNQGDNSQPIASEAWFGSKDGRIMACKVPASQGCGAWHAVFVKSALGWETERDAVMVSSWRTCELDRISIGSSDRGAATSMSQEANR
jgi:hypothetical protein